METAVHLPPNPVADFVPAASPAEPSKPRRWLSRAFGWTAHIDRPLWILTLVGGLMRFVFVMFLHKPAGFDYSDMQSYMDRALQMADHHYKSTTGDWYYPGGTSAFLSLALRFFGAPRGWAVDGFLQAAMSTAEIPFVYFACRRWFSRSIAIVAAGLFTFNFLAISYSGFFMSESYLTIGLIAASVLLVPERPWRCLAAGLVLGFGAWAKSQAVLLVPLWGLVLLLKHQRRSALMLAIGGFGVVIPISLYVSIASGHPVYMSNNGGQTFALAHCPIKSIKYSDPKTNTGAEFGIPTVYQRIGQGDEEATWQDAHYTEPFDHGSYYMKEGFKCMLRYPKYTAKCTLMHLLDTFAGVPWSPVSPWPESNTGWQPLAIGDNLLISYLFFPLTLWAVWRRRRDVGTHYLVSLPIFSLLSSAVLFHGDPRFRTPYDVCFLIGGAIALEEWRRRKHRSGWAAPGLVGEP